MAVGRSGNHIQGYPVGTNGRRAFEAPLASVYQASARLLAATRGLGDAPLTIIGPLVRSRAPRTLNGNLARLMAVFRLSRLGTRNRSTP